MKLHRYSPTTSEISMREKVGAISAMYPVLGVAALHPCVFTIQNESLEEAGIHSLVVNQRKGVTYGQMRVSESSMVDGLVGGSLTFLCSEAQ